MRSLLICFAILITSCSTIRFNNGDTHTSYETESWHHIGILRLVEFSDPYNVQKACDSSEWSSVRTRTGPLQVLVGIIAGGLYDPEEVAVACSK